MGKTKKQGLSAPKVPSDMKIAKKAIQELFSNTRRSPEETRDLLRELQCEIEDYCASINADIARDETTEED